MKAIRFVGDSLKRLREFPEDARHDAGYQLDKLQRGLQPDDFKRIRASPCSHGHSDVGNGCTDPKRQRRRLGPRQHLKRGHQERRLQ